MRKWLLLSGLLLVLILAACAPQASTTPVLAPAPAPTLAAPPIPAAVAPAVKPAWQEQWEHALAAGKRENRVLIATSAVTARAVITETFKKEYGISAEFIEGRGAELVAKIQTERRAGLYSYDIGLIGPTTSLTVLKPAGVNDRLEPALILPDVTDPELIKKVWWQKKLWWVDTDHTLLVAALRLSFPIAINTNLVKDGEIKSLRDLLDPKWQGKVVMCDPSVSGTGATFYGFADEVLGHDYLAALAKTRPTVVRDERLILEWLAHGKFAVAVPPKQDLLGEFIRLGAPIKGLTPTEGTWVASAESIVSLFKDAPHPNASKIFINWFLSKEGQTSVVKVLSQESLRMDVSNDHIAPEQRRQDGVNYFSCVDEKVILKQPEEMKKGKELFGPLMQ